MSTLVGPAPIPRVSVGLPVYNGENFLDEAIRSVLGQTMDSIELIISDNASTDHTEEICRTWSARDERVRYVRNPANRGATANYNAVATLARGEYFKWMAHDDTIAPPFLERCVKMLDARPDVVLAYTTVRDIDFAGESIAVRSTGLRADSDDPVERFRQLIRLHYLCEAVFGVMRRETLIATGLLDTYADCDRVLLAQLGLAGRFVEIDEPFLLHRQHGERSVVRYPSRQKRGAWFSPSAGGRPGFPYTREWIGFAAAIRGARMAPGQRWRCGCALVRWGITNRDGLWEDIDFAVRYLLRPWKRRITGRPVHGETNHER